MATPYPVPDPNEVQILLDNPTYEQPTQRPILAAYAAGEIGIETLVYRLVQEVKERAPQEAAQRASAAAERAEQARIEAEMAANDDADEPTFIAVTPDGKPLAVATAASTTEQQPDEADAADEPTGESSTEGTGDFDQYNDSDWVTGENTENQPYDGDD